VLKEQVFVEKEFIESYDSLSQNQKELLKDFFKIIS
jgi:mRNA-degrading endonuclease RelE of RelBE toxin-antitoxin system